MMGHNFNLFLQIVSFYTLLWILSTEIESTEIRSQTIAKIQVQCELVEMKD